jgi:hypothetical protein
LKICPNFMAGHQPLAGRIGITAAVLSRKNFCALGVYRRRDVSQPGAGEDDFGTGDKAVGATGGLQWLEMLCNQLHEILA